MLIERRLSVTNVSFLVIAFFLLSGALFQYRANVVRIQTIDAAPSIPTVQVIKSMPSAISGRPKLTPNESLSIEERVSLLQGTDKEMYLWAAYACKQHDLLPELPSESDTVHQSLTHAGASHTIVQICSHPNSKIQPFFDNFAAYARRHGYNYIVRKKPRARTEEQKQLNAYWDRQIILQEVLEDELDRSTPDQRQHWVFMAEADTIILNHLITLESLLPPLELSRDVDMLIGRDGWGINPGTFFLKVTQWSWQLVFNTIWTGLNMPATLLPLHDQSALQVMFPLDKAAVCPRALINAWPAVNPFEASYEKDEGTPGSFLSHFSGAFKPWLDGYETYLHAANWTTYWEEGKERSLRKSKEFWDDWALKYG